MENIENIENIKDTKVIVTEFDENFEVDIGIVINEFIVEYCVGSGSHGKVFKAKHTITNERVAIKVENKGVKVDYLENEVEVYEVLKKENVTPKLFGVDILQSGQLILILEYVGPSLLQAYRDGYITKNNHSLIFTQLINLIFVLHDNDYIHVDIKPGNFVMGINDNSHKVYLIDFGLSEKWRNSQTIDDQNCKFRGNFIYCSLKAHTDGHRRSRRDDLESLGYVFIHLLGGVLPWCLLTYNKSTKRKIIRDSKASTTLTELVSGLHPNIEKYLIYTRNLKFEEEPNYDYLKNLMIEI